MPRTHLFLLLASLLLCQSAFLAAARKHLLQDAASPATSADTTGTTDSGAAAVSPPVGETAPNAAAAASSAPEATAPAAGTTPPTANTTAATGGTGAAGAAGGNMTGGGGALSFPTFAQAVEAANTTGAANMSILIAALNATGILSANISNSTILAPNNQAFEKVLTDLGLTQEQLLADNVTLISVLADHVIPNGTFLSSNLTDGMNLTTLAGHNLTVVMNNASSTGAVGETSTGVTTGQPTVMFLAPNNGTNATVLVPDILAGDNVIHVIDGVLLVGNQTASEGAAGGAGAAATGAGAAAGNATEAAGNATTSGETAAGPLPGTEAPNVGGA